MVLYAGKHASSDVVCNEEIISIPVVGYRDDFLVILSTQVAYYDSYSHNSAFIVSWCRLFSTDWENLV